MLLLMLSQSLITLLLLIVLSQSLIKFIFSAINNNSNIDYYFTPNLRQSHVNISLSITPYLVQFRHSLTPSIGQSRHYLPQVYVIYSFVPYLDQFRLFNLKSGSVQTFFSFTYFKLFFFFCSDGLQSSILRLAIFDHCTILSGQRVVFYDDLSVIKA